MNILPALLLSLWAIPKVCVRSCEKRKMTVKPKKEAPCRGIPDLRGNFSLFLFLLSSSARDYSTHVDPSRKLFCGQMDQIR